MTPSTVSSRAFVRQVLRLAVFPIARSAAPASIDEKVQTVIHTLNCGSIDCPDTVNDGKVTDEDAYQEEREFADQVLALLGQLTELAGKEARLHDVQALAAHIEAKAPRAEISGLARALAAAVIQRYRPIMAPKQAPEPATAASPFQARCAVCHGPQGRGDGPAAPGMDPAPTNFHDAARMDKRSIDVLYNTVTLGVAGTAIRAFTELSETDRLAFLTSGMRTWPTQVAQGEALWAKGTGKAEMGDARRPVTSKPADVRAAERVRLVAVRAYLIAQPGAVASAAPSPLILAHVKLADALAAHRAGDRAAARRHAVTAHLEGLELVEGSLDNVDPALRRKTEEAMMVLRSEIDADEPVGAFGQRAEQMNACSTRRIACRPPEKCRPLPHSLACC